MSPRVIQLPMSGRDRRHYVQQLRLAEQTHASLLVQVAAAFRTAYDLAAQEWNTRQFIGGDAAPSPSIAQAIAGGRPLLEVKCKRCGHGSMVDLTEALWPRQNQVHTLAKVLRSSAARMSERSRRPTWSRCMPGSRIEMSRPPRNAASK